MLSSLRYDTESSTWRSASCHRRVDVGDILSALPQGETLVVGKLLDCRRRVQLDCCAVDNCLSFCAQPPDYFVRRARKKSFLELRLWRVVGSGRLDLRPHGSLPRLCAR